VPLLADTSIWIDHFRRMDRELAERLARGDIVIHPFVVGELSLGTHVNFAAIADDLLRLPGAKEANHNEVLAFIAANRLAGAGIGYVDAHLLASARLTVETKLWTRDKKLRAVAVRLKLAADGLE
jgi:predicted nucleic acid-binding protein